MVKVKFRGSIIEAWNSLDVTPDQLVDMLRMKQSLFHEYRVCQRADAATKVM